MLDSTLGFGPPNEVCSKTRQTMERVWMPAPTGITAAMDAGSVPSERDDVQSSGTCLLLAMY